jgi:hypothetical protein
MHKYTYLISLCAILSGCATPAAVDQMTARDVYSGGVGSATPLKNSISVRSVSGGQETNPMLMSKVSNEGFQQALEQSLQKALLLAPDANTSTYLLDAKLASLEQPWGGLDMKVTAAVEYSLEEKATGEQLFVRTISTPFTATFGDAALGMERLKIANEGAVRENIEELINGLLILQNIQPKVSVDGQ